MVYLNRIQGNKISIFEPYKTTDKELYDFLNFNRITTHRAKRLAMRNKYT